MQQHHLCFTPVFRDVVVVWMLDLVIFLGQSKEMKLGVTQYLTP